MPDLGGFGAQLLAGTLVTLQLAVTAAALGMGLALMGAAAKLWGSAPARWAAEAYTTVVRGVPELLVVLVVYFGAASVLGFFFSPFAAGTLALGLTFGAYATEVLRGALAAIPPGQAEAGLALGLRRHRVFLSILLPQAWRIALPGLGNLFLVLMKDTALVSVIGLDELMRKSAIAVSALRQPFTVYLAAALIYLALTAAATAGLAWLERRAR